MCLVSRVGIEPLDALLDFRTGVVGVGFEFDDKRSGILLPLEFMDRGGEVAQTGTERHTNIFPGVIESFLILAMIMIGEMVLILQQQTVVMNLEVP